MMGGECKVIEETSDNCLRAGEITESCKRCSLDRVTQDDNFHMLFSAVVSQ